MNGDPRRPSLDDERDTVTLWLLDCLAEAESALAAAGSMRWSESQIQELREEVAFFAALAQRSPNPPRPSDHVLQHVRSMLMILGEREGRSRNLGDLSPRQKARLDEYLDSLQRVRSAIERFD